jgi:hypothetical protein
MLRIWLFVCGLMCITCWCWVLGQGEGAAVEVCRDVRSGDAAGGGAGACVRGLWLVMVQVSAPQGHFTASSCIDPPTADVRKSASSSH